MLWSMKMADLAAVRMPSTKRSSFSVSLSERPIVGSSRMMMSASKWSARTMARPWRSPPESPVTVVSGVSTADVKPISSLISPWVMRRISPTRRNPRRPAMGRPMKMLRQSGSCSARARSWKTVSTPRARAFCTSRSWTRCPLNQISPRSGWWTPVMTLMSVDLPAPLSPSRPTTSPLASWKLTSCRTWTPPKDL